MSDEPDRAENAASEDTPAPSPAEPEAKQPPGEPADEASAPAPEEPSPEEPPSESAEEPSDGTAPEQADDEEEAPEEPEPAAQSKPAKPPAAAPPAHYDGLESGLAWFGIERFEPPAPVGYEPPPAEPERPAKELSVQERRRIQGRFEARRKEVETQKTWYQKFPLGALSMLPVLVVLIIVAILYPPWRTAAFPNSKEPLNESILSAQPLANQSEALALLGVAEALPSKSWRVLPGGILAMTATEPNAKVTFALPRGLAQAEISCDLCILDRDPGAWGATLTVDPTVEMALKTNPVERGKDWVAGRYTDGRLGGPAHEIKPRMWNSVKLVVGAEDTTYYFNGSKLGSVGPRPRALGKVELTTYNTRLLLRNWRVETPK